MTIGISCSPEGLAIFIGTKYFRICSFDVKARQTERQRYSHIYNISKHNDTDETINVVDNFYEVADAVLAETKHF